MHSLILCCLVAVTVAVPQYYNKANYYQQSRYQQPQYYRKPNVPIISATNQLNQDGSFKYSYATGDGQQAQAVGYLKNPGYRSQEAEVVQGSFSYTSPEGKPVAVTYVADENGFQPHGSHIPTPPPVPEPILRSLAYNAQSERNQYRPSYNQYRYYGH